MFAPHRSLWAVPVLATSLVLAPRLAHAADRSVDVAPGVTLTFAEVPAGAFRQGSPASEVGREPDEVERDVTLTSAYFMGKTPVTVKAFRAFVTETKYRTEAEQGSSGGFGWDGKALVQKPEFSWKNPGFSQGDDHPVVIVTLEDAKSFARWAAQKTGESIRLPSEAEWERAARGTETTFSTSWGEAHGFPKGAGVGTHKVDEKPANGLGLFAMVGNVNEWTLDFYAPRTKDDAIDPRVETAQGSPPRMVLKGGSWNRDARRARPASRYASSPGSRMADNGFRLVLTKEAPMLKPGVGLTPEPPLTLKEPKGPAPGESPSEATPSDSGGGAGWLAILMVPVGLGAGLAAYFAATKKEGAAGAAGSVPGVPGNVSTEAKADGFVVRSALGAGSRVRYEAFVSGTKVSDVVVVDGPETFVFTGGPPTAIRILEVTPVQASYRGDRASGGARGSSASRGSGARVVPVVHHHHHHESSSNRRDDDDDPPRPFLGSPSAY
jgi:sulfatase modifying factor 1